MITLKATAKCDGPRFGLFGCEDQASCEVELSFRLKDRYTDNDGEEQHSHEVEVPVLEVVALPEEWRDVGFYYGSTYTVRCPTCAKKDREK